MLVTSTIERSDDGESRKAAVRRKQMPLIAVLSTRKASRSQEIVSKWEVTTLDHISSASLRLMVPHAPRSLASGCAIATLSLGACHTPRAILPVDVLIEAVYCTCAHVAGMPKLASTTSYVYLDGHPLPHTL